MCDESKFTASGGPLYLGVLLKTFEQWHNKQPIDPVELSVTSNLKDPKEMDNLEWLQWYYFDVCNGDWEHTYGVKIEAVKEGWTLSIDIADTTFEDFEYEGVDTEHYRCWLEKRVFKGTGGRDALDEMIGEFRRWMAVVYTNLGMRKYHWGINILIHGGKINLKQKGGLNRPFLFRRYDLTLEDIRLGLGFLCLYVIQSVTLHHCLLWPKYQQCADFLRLHHLHAQKCRLLGHRLRSFG